jgi:hypothetical protein
VKLSVGSRVIPQHSIDVTVLIVWQMSICRSTDVAANLTVTSQCLMDGSMLLPNQRSTARRCFACCDCHGAEHQSCCEKGLHCFLHG